VLSCEGSLQQCDYQSEFRSLVIGVYQHLQSFSRATLLAGKGSIDFLHKCKRNTLKKANARLLELFRYKKCSGITQVFWQDRRVQGNHPSSTTYDRSPLTKHKVSVWLVSMKLCLKSMTGICVKRMLIPLLRIAMEVPEQIMIPQNQEDHLVPPALGKHTPATSGSQVRSMIA
jgi:hypothetical protein